MTALQCALPHEPLGVPEAAMREPEGRCSKGRAA